MAAWSGMSRQDYIIAKLTNTEVEVRPSVSVQKALKDSMAELAKEVRLAVSYGELNESLQQRIELWAEKRAQVENGEIDADEYEDWKASL